MSKAREYFLYKKLRVGIFTRVKITFMNTDYYSRVMGKTREFYPTIMNAGPELLSKTETH